MIQKKIASASLRFLAEEYGNERAHNEHLNNLFTKLQIELRSLDGENKSSDKYQAVYLKILERQRKLLEKMNHSAEYDEELIRKYLSLIDLEEFKIREKQIREMPSVDH